MASKRFLKKQLNALTFDVVEECFNIQMFDESKVETTNSLIEEVVNYRNSYVERMHQAKNKKEYRPLMNELDEKGDEFLNRLHSIG
jgi:hypothetical protein